MAGIQRVLLPGREGGGNTGCIIFQAYMYIHIYHIYIYTYIHIYIYIYRFKYFFVVDMIKYLIKFITLKSTTAIQ